MPDRQSRIADWVCTGTGLVKGTTLQVGRYLETSPERCVLIRETGGVPYMTQIKDDVMYQFISRAISPADSLADSRTVYNFLYKNGLITLPPAPAAEEVWIDAIEPVSLPQYLGEDDKGRTLYSTNYKFMLSMKGGKI